MYRRSAALSIRRLIKAGACSNPALEVSFSGSSQSLFRSLQSTETCPSTSFYVSRRGLFRNTAVVNWSQSDMRLASTPSSDSSPKAESTGRPQAATSPKSESASSAEGAASGSTGGASTNAASDGKPAAAAGTGVFALVSWRSLLYYGITGPIFVYGFAVLAEPLSFYINATVGFYIFALLFLPRNISAPLSRMFGSIFNFWGDLLSTAEGNILLKVCRAIGKLKPLAGFLPFPLQALIIAASTVSSADQALNAVRRYFWGSLYWLCFVGIVAGVWFGRQITLNDILAKVSPSKKPEGATA